MNLTRQKKRSLTQRVLLIFLTWLVAAVISAIIGFVFFNPLAGRKLIGSGVRTEGRVIALEPDNHQIVRYEYKVGNESFTGSGHAGSGNPPFRELSIGDVVVVFYDPGNPKSASLGYPQGLYYRNWGGVIFATIVLPIVIVGSLYRMGYIR